MMGNVVPYNKKLAAAVTVNPTSTTVVADIDLTGLRAFIVCVKNLGVTALNTFSLQRGPDGTTWPKVVDSTTLATLAGGASGEIAVNPNSGGHYQMVATVASGTTTLDIWVVGRD